MQMFFDKPQPTNNYKQNVMKAWTPHLIKDIETLERVERTTTRLVPKLKKFDYSSRSKMLAIPSPDDRTRGDMIEVYKLISGKEKVDQRQFFSRSHRTSTISEDTTYKVITTMVIRPLDDLT